MKRGESDWKVNYKEFREMADYVRSRLEDTAERNGDRMRWYPWQSAEYRFDHTLSVVDLGEKIAREEKADEDIIRVAALFHDVAKFEVGEENHAEEGAWITQKYLSKRGFPDEFIEKTAQTVKHHAKDINNNLPFESKVLIEADSIEKIGIGGATMMALRVGFESRSHSEIPRMIDKVIRRGKNVLDSMETETGEKIARERIERVKAYRDWFKEELPASSYEPR